MAPAHIASIELAGPMGFEPTTSDVTGRRSNRAELRPHRNPSFYRFRLSYTTMTGANLDVIPIAVSASSFRAAAKCGEFEIHGRNHRLGRWLPVCHSRASGLPG